MKDDDVPLVLIVKSVDNNVTIKKLYEYSKTLKIRLYSKYHKNDLIAEVVKYAACILIQRWYRKIKMKKIILINETDPITMEDLETNYFLILIDENHGVGYNYESLIDYLIESGEFIEPTSRKKISDADLKRLDSESKIFGVKRRKSVYVASKNLRRYVLKKRKANEILTFEYECGYYTTQIRKLAEKSMQICCHDIAMQKYEHLFHEHIFPSYVYTIINFARRDRERAIQTIDQNMELIIGPPNKRVVSEFLDCMIMYMYDLKFSLLDE